MARRAKRTFSRPFGPKLDPAARLAFKIWSGVGKASFHRTLDRQGSRRLDLARGAIKVPGDFLSSCSARDLAPPAIYGMLKDNCLMRAENGAFTVSLAADTGRQREGLEGAWATDVSRSCRGE
jgi:hypothetical protein